MAQGCGAGFVVEDFVCLPIISLLGTSVSRSSSLNNYIPFFPPTALCPLAFLLMFWLGFAAHHRPHTRLTAPFLVRSLEIPSGCPSDCCLQQLYPSKLRWHP